LLMNVNTGFAVFAYCAAVSTTSYAIAFTKPSPNDRVATRADINSYIHPYIKTFCSGGGEG